MASVIGKGAGLLQFRERDQALMRLPAGDLVDYAPETLRWIDKVDATGGTYRKDSKAIADSVIRAITGQSFNARILWLMAFLGDNLAAGLVPLIDRIGAGIPGSINFTDADFRQSRGLTSAGGKILDSNIKPGGLGAGRNGGIGVWVTQIGTGGTTSSPLGMAFNPGGGTRAYDIFVGTTSYGLEWNQDLVGRSPTVVAPATTGHYYGQRSSDVLRTLDLNGVQKAFSTISDPADGASATTIKLMGSDTTNVVPGPRYWAGRSGLFYMTDGGMTYAERTAFHQLIRAKLMVPTGRAL